jgi:D-aminoacyl-tRNA deacylase
MIGLLQRVTQAQVTVGGEPVGAIERGLLVLIGVQRGDTEARAQQLLARLLRYRVFPDASDRMNHNVQEIGGGLLLVPQFTLAADTRSGTRASFTAAAAPADAQRLFDYLMELARQQHSIVASGRFGADMQVALVNDGPVTFWLET